MSIPFNKPFMAGDELRFIDQAYRQGALAGDGIFTKKCQTWLEQNVGVRKALLTHSCTAALEMSAILTNIEPGDEVILPSYTFVSTANAFVLRGAVPVFCDIREDTLNLDENCVEELITEKTKAIVPVHYAGVACEMDALTLIAKKNKLFLIEDAAQGLMSSYKGKPLGSIGDFGAVSFHETKNVISGEGGALLIRDDFHIERAEIIREKGTNRTNFNKGVVDKYTWIDVGSSFLPGELVAAFLFAQLTHAVSITANRVCSWDYYHALLEPLEKKGLLRRPVVPKECAHNAHMYYVLVENEIVRASLIKYLRERGIDVVFHYVPLHSSQAGKRFGRTKGVLKNTDMQSARLIRLPLWVGLSREDQESVVEKIFAFYT